jgi:hypothetical protein
MNNYTDLYMTMFEGGYWIRVKEIKIPITELIAVGGLGLAALRRGNIIYDFVIANKFPTISPWRSCKWLICDSDALFLGD